MRRDAPKHLTERAVSLQEQAGAAYWTLVRSTRHEWAWPSMEQIDVILTAAGQSFRGLLHDLHPHPDPKLPYRGKRCPHCGRGRRVNYSTRRHGTSASRYFRCDTCGRPCGKQTVPSGIVPRRRSRRGPRKRVLAK